MYSGNLSLRTFYFFFHSKIFKFSNLFEFKRFNRINSNFKISKFKFQNFNVSCVFIYNAMGCLKIYAAHNNYFLLLATKIAIYDVHCFKKALKNMINDLIDSRSRSS